MSDRTHTTRRTRSGPGTDAVPAAEAAAEVEPYQPTRLDMVCKYTVGSVVATGAAFVAINLSSSSASADDWGGGFSDYSFSDIGISSSSLSDFSTPSAPTIDFSASYTPSVSDYVAPAPMPDLAPMPELDLAPTPEFAYAPPAQPEIAPAPMNESAPAPAPEPAPELDLELPPITEPELPVAPTPVVEASPTPSMPPPAVGAPAFELPPIPAPELPVAPELELPPVLEPELPAAPESPLQIEVVPPPPSQLPDPPVFQLAPWDKLLNADVGVPPTQIPLAPVVAAPAQGGVPTAGGSAADLVGPTGIGIDEGQSFGRAWDQTFATDPTGGAQVTLGSQPSSAPGSAAPGSLPQQVDFKLTDTPVGEAGTFSVPISVGGTDTPATVTPTLTVLPDGTAIPSISASTTFTSGTTINGTFAPDNSTLSARQAIGDRGFVDVTYRTMDGSVALGTAVPVTDSVTVGGDLNLGNGVGGVFVSAERTPVGDLTARWGSDGGAAVAWKPIPELTGTVSRGPDGEVIGKVEYSTTFGGPQPAATPDVPETEDTFGRTYSGTGEYEFSDTVPSLVLPAAPEFGVTNPSSAPVSGSQPSPVSSPYTDSQATPSVLNESTTSGSGDELRAVTTYSRPQDLQDYTITATELGPGITADVTSGIDVGATGFFGRSGVDWSTSDLTIGNPSLYSVADGSDDPAPQFPSEGVLVAGPVSAATARPKAGDVVQVNGKPYVFNSPTSLTPVTEGVMGPKAGDIVWYNGRQFVHRSVTNAQPILAGFTFGCVGGGLTTPWPPPMALRGCLIEGGKGAAGGVAWGTLGVPKLELVPVQPRRQSSFTERENREGCGGSDLTRRGVGNSQARHSCD